MKTREKILNILIGVLGVVSLWIVFSHMWHFKYPDYFYNANPNIETYVGYNVIGPFVDFSFFTYLTMILFGMWCILFTISQIFKLNRLNHFIRSKHLVAFVYCNYVITISLYTVFQFVSGDRLGWYGNYPLSWHSVGTSIIGHYIIFVLATIIFVKLNVTESKGKPYYIFISCFLVLYYAIVKIMGEFAYSFRWFPYVIFDAKSFGSIFGITNYPLSVTMLVVACIAIFMMYMLLLKLLVKSKSREHH